MKPYIQLVGIVYELFLVASEQQSCILASLKFLGSHHLAVFAPCKLSGRFVQCIGPSGIYLKILTFSRCRGASKAFVVTLRIAAEEAD
jgi:hypothetical protein